jgi:hypothetical protein
MGILSPRPPAYLIDARRINRQQQSIFVEKWPSDASKESLVEAFWRAFKVRRSIREEFRRR